MAFSFKSEKSKLSVSEASWTCSRVYKIRFSTYIHMSKINTCAWKMDMIKLWLVNTPLMVVIGFGSVFFNQQKGT